MRRLNFQREAEVWAVTADEMVELPARPARMNFLRCLGMQNALVLVDQPLDLLILLILGHFLVDFPLQGDKMAVEKCPGKDVTLNWRWWLSAHAATHGFMVAVLTGVPILGLAETLIHGLIDFGKCRFGYKLIVDQALHWACKIIWAASMVVFL